VNEYVNGAKTFFGPPNATHLWQPVDHNVGARYHFLMAAAYDRWMVSDAATRYITDGTVPVDVRRKLLTAWAGDAYRQLEVEREKCETARETWLAGDKKEPEPERSLFYKAFARTGNLVTVDGSLDEEIRVDEVEKLFPQFYMKIVKPASVINDLNKFREEDWVFEFDSDDNLVQYEDDGVAVYSAVESNDDANSDVEQDSEDVDDESGTDQEPVPDNLEVRCACGGRSCKCDRDGESSSDDELVLVSAARHRRAKQAEDAELAEMRERLKYNWAVPERQPPADNVHDALMEEVNNMPAGAKRKRKQVVAQAFMIQENSREEPLAKKRKTNRKAAKPKPKTSAKPKNPTKPKTRAKQTGRPAKTDCT
jgi:hypothetical protein